MFKSLVVHKVWKLVKQSVSRWKQCTLLWIQILDTKSGLWSLGLWVQVFSAWKKGLSKDSSVNGWNGFLKCVLWEKRTHLDGKDGEVVNGVGLPVQVFGRADDPSMSIHVEEPLQVCVPVNGVPGEKEQRKHQTQTHTRKQYTLLASVIDLTFYLWEEIIMVFLFIVCLFPINL